MQAFIVGADRLGNIPALLAEYGIDIAHHVSGRMPSHQRKPASIQTVDLIIAFTDFLNHNAMRNYRNLARTENIHFIASRRSTTELKMILTQLRNREVH